MTLPDSEPVKKQQMDEMEPGDSFPRWLYVHELKALLETVPDEYWIVAAETHNLLFGSDEDVRGRGMVDMLWRQIETWGPLSDEDQREYPLETEGGQ